MSSYDLETLLGLSLVIGGAVTLLVGIAIAYWRGDA